MSARIEDLSSLVALNLTGLIGIVTYRRLVESFGSAKGILSAGLRQLQRVEGIGHITAQAIVDVQREGVEKELKLVEREGVKVVPYYSQEYPKALKRIHDYPLVLYIKGTLKPQDDCAIAIVGSRRCTRYGQRQAHRLARELAELGICIVSGLARGIDTSAHLGALQVKGGRTIAVLGSGLCRIYPSENLKLSEKIAQNGALISEFPMNAPPDAEHFPRRNRVISGLSLGVVIAEAGEYSGALITADWALEQGREVFCIPGPIDNPMSKGCHRWIQQGAKLTSCTEDVLEELYQLHPFLQGLERKRRPSLTPLEYLVWSKLSARPCKIEEIAQVSRVPGHVVSSILVQLVAKNAAREVKDSLFVRHTIS
jgi:DNA processing protein